MRPRALVVEDEPDVARLVAYHLEAAGFDVEQATHGVAALARATAAPPALVVLDVGLPDGDGFEVCRRLRADPRTARAGVLMLTARASPDDRVAGLEAGADDFLAKPFVVRELVLRARAVVGRLAPRAEAAAVILRAATIELDPVAREVRVVGAVVALRALEYGVLLLLLSPPRRTFTREEMLELVWGARGPVNVRMVDVTVSRLRSALGDAGAMVETVVGHGYRLRQDPP